MTEQTPQVVRSYLAQLDSALEGIPAELARDIRSGVEEELAGLDAPTASERIEELGDPVFIAAEARDAMGTVPARSVVLEAPASTLSASRGFAITAALLVGIGGFIVPIAGWIVGMVMMWMSSAWRRWEKWVATLAIPGAAILAGIVAAIGSALGQPNGEVPIGMLSGWHVFLIGVPSTIVVGIWLLWRARGRVFA
ncbi:HAAS signaling domain-containing protein [Mycetocola zhujimingii]|uniref:Uncharacterized protein n=1 Tax=Mycetocola zhujimingii TaxID=2079792 RepID=A0A2U1TEN2_9MICO|nr:hypothetical protein [Mycetocola zhujimingii]PWC07342.1 hypothetical protein DF223_06880 [Mycetocola zhujimingii]